MGSTDHEPTAHDAVTALRTVHSAQQAAARQSQPASRGHLVAQGLASGVGFVALGLAQSHPDQTGPLLGLGATALVGFLVVTWLSLHRGGAVPWFARGERTLAWHTWTVPFLLFAVGGLAAIFYGPAGWFIGFGITAALTFWLRAARRARP